ncbi:MAG TPA: hypothetical protein VKT73_13275 [Xanthobacteraceae bacterium]|nr:hypothetical protein [Xanthobacteraceae bacterium]
MTVVIDKPKATSAATTAFCATKIYGPSDGFLWIDGNGKITANNGTLDDPKPNAFSLVEIQDCPGSTEVCRAACYVHGLKKHAPATHALYVHNSKMIRQILATKGPENRWSLIVGQWIEKNCQGGFRWHVSGDVFSLEYAYWIAQVVGFSTTVDHWIYTRSFDFIGPLVAMSRQRGGNLAINLSCDSENYFKALRLANEFKLRLCYLTRDGRVPENLPDGSVIFPDYNLRGGTAEGAAWFANLPAHYKSFVCPVDFHGKSDRRRCGPCDRCMF